MGKKHYWKGIEALMPDAAFVQQAHREFSEYLPINQNKTENPDASETSRRDFLKMMGFGIAAASLAACEAPVRKAIPYLNNPVDVDPGIPNYYASTFMQGGDYCGIVIKTHEGRPIKIQGNELCPITQGGVNAQVEASVLSLYDKARLTTPYSQGKPIDWNQLDQIVMQQLTAMAAQGKQIRIVSNTILSPSTKAALAIFQKKYPTTRHIVYDPQSCSAMEEANRQSFNRPVIPTYDFSKAAIIVSFSADFLGTWLSSIAFTKQYSQTRKLGKAKRTMSRHYQLEANLSLTGANADCRIPLKPSEEPLTILLLHELLKHAHSHGISPGRKIIEILAHELRYYQVQNDKTIKKQLSIAKSMLPIAKDLWQNRGASLVVAGANDKLVQSMVNDINYFLGNYDKTIFLNRPVHFRQGNDVAMRAFVRTLTAGKIDAVLFLNANPVYDHPEGRAIAQALPKVPLTIATNDRFDETASLVQHVAPDHHYLEAWNDASPQAGVFSLAQPTITPLFNTRQAPESFLVWAGYTPHDYYTFLQNQWQTTLFPQQSKIRDFQKFWNQCLFNGIFEIPLPKYQAPKWNGGAKIDTSGFGVRYPTSPNGLELVLYEKMAIGHGAQANNPWLQEMPDPISKACWDNYITVAPSWAQAQGIAMQEGETRMAQLKVGNHTLQIPVLVQPGQAPGTIGLALGFGRTKAGPVANGVGVHATPLLIEKKGYTCYTVTQDVYLEVLPQKYRIAQTQTHETYMNRHAVIQEATLQAYQKNPAAGQHRPTVATKKGPKKATDITLWQGHKYPNHHWGLVIDMNACTGCGACTVACQAENNVPVVGRQEVLNRREMHWIRIDRYYSSDALPTDQKGLEKAAENPEVTFQPMMCQHCNNAPCETVCPVLATTHSSEGLNQMTYNRCIGTRYCANNCPYKVRRFNWFKYHDNKKFAENTSMNNDLGKMVLNPDVTVRARGVMEKCTLCVQRIQAGKLKAKMEKRKLHDHDINTACAASCPASAMVFGDMNNSESQISKLLTDEIDERAYHVLEEIGTKPNVSYLTKIRNKVP